MTTTTPSERDERIEELERRLAFARGFLAGLVGRLEDLQCVCSATHCAIDSRALPGDIRAALAVLNNELPPLDAQQVEQRRLLPDDTGRSEQQHPAAGALDVPRE